MKVLIIGGVAGGASAAARLRRLDETADICLIERSGYISYANCGLPYYVGGVITDRDALTLQTPESFRDRFRIDVRVREEAVAIDPVAKTVTVHRLKDGSTYVEHYDTLLLSPGAKPVRPPLPGIDSDRVFTLRTVEDAARIRRFVEQNHPQTAVVVGGGYIGLEMTENLQRTGVRTTVVQLTGQVMETLDYDMACEVHAYLRRQGVDLRLGTAVTGFASQGGAVRTDIRDGEALMSDMVILAVGVVPDTALAKDAGLTLDTRGAIVVNDRMETSVPDVYAVGDAVEVRHLVTGTPALIPLAGPANKQGRIAADNIAGGDSRYRGSQGTSILRLFDLTIAVTGINERQAQAASVPYDRVVTYAASHAGYYPGATNMTIKTLFDPVSGTILGAQLIGLDGVDKRADVLATAIRAGLTAADLAELELAYAPPYSSAKDPVNMAGFVIENVRAGLVHQYHWSDIPQIAETPDALFLDVRTPAEFARGAIDGAVNIPLDELRARLGELDRSRTLYVNCHSGLRSYLACRLLTQHGFTCYNLAGGYRFYAAVQQDTGFDDTPRHPCGLPLHARDGR